MSRLCLYNTLEEGLWIVKSAGLFSFQIPFSKFLLSHKGRIQDKQEMLHLDRVRNFAITLSDDAQGPFQLEIDYIGLVYDAYHTDTFFYEMYDGDPLMS